jgi:amidase
MSITASAEAASVKAEAFIEKVRVAPYQQNGALTGLTFAVKDNIDVAGITTGCGNPTWLQTHPAASSHAVCVEQLLWEGGLCLGKTITDELAYDLTGENHFYGTPMNTRAPERVPGGSSAGSAAAVAGGYVDFALGTDTVGSCRVPAANCGLFGYRPSHDAVSMAGVARLSPSFDTVGVIAARADALSRAGGVLLSAAVPTAPALKRFLLIKEAFEIVDEDVRTVLQEPVRQIASILGLKVEELSLRRLDRQPTEGWLEDWLAIYKTISLVEIWSTFGPWIEEHNPSFGPRIAKNFEYAKQQDRKKLTAAMRFRETLYKRSIELLDDGDLLCMPTVPSPAPRKGSVGADRYRNEYLQRTVSLCSIASLCRMPQVTIPVASVDKVPIGLSLLARHDNDMAVLGAVGVVGPQVAEKV